MNAIPHSGERATLNGFALLPWAEHFREGRMPRFPDSWIAVLPVIVAHANERREAWPGYARICALSRVSRKTLHEAIESLVDKKWIARFTRTTGKHTHNVYRLLCGDNLPSRHWIAIHHAMIFSGVWGAMRPSDRKVYLMLRAFAWRGGHALPDVMFNDEENLEEEEWSVFHGANFLPAHRYNPAEFQRLSGMNERTYRDAFAWLLTNGLVSCTGNSDGLSEGLLMPFNPGLHAPNIESQVEAAKLETSLVKVIPGAKRSLTCALRRQTATRKPRGLLTAMGEPINGNGRTH